MSAIESSDDRYKEKGYTVSDYGQSISTDNKALAFIFDKTYSEYADQKRIWPEAEKVIKRTIEDCCNCAILAFG